MTERIVMLSMLDLNMKNRVHSVLSEVGTVIAKLMTGLLETSRKSLILGARAISKKSALKKRKKNTIDAVMKIRDTLNPPFLSHVIHMSSA